MLIFMIKQFRGLSINNNEEFKMTLQDLMDALHTNNARKIREYYDALESRSKDISAWVYFFGLPKDETYSIQISHKVRNQIMTGLNYHFGAKHLDNKRFPALAKTGFKLALNDINLMLLIKDQLNYMNPVINQILYPKD